MTEALKFFISLQFALKLNLMPASRLIRCRKNVSCQSESPFFGVDTACHRASNKSIYWNEIDWWHRANIGSMMSNQMRSGWYPRIRCKLHNFSIYIYKALVLNCKQRKQFPAWEFLMNDWLREANVGFWGMRMPRRSGCRESSEEAPRQSSFECLLNSANFPALVTAETFKWESVEKFNGCSDTCFISALASCSDCGRRSRSEQFLRTTRCSIFS